MGIMVYSLYYGNYGIFLINDGNYGIFLIMAHAGFCPSAVVIVAFSGSPSKEPS